MSAATVRTTLQTVATLDVAAASGLVLRAGELIVISDDDRRLARYSTAGDPRGRIDLPVGPAQLPDDPRERKKKKPDFEALALLPDGALLALGSGSSKHRRTAGWVDADLAEARAIDLSRLYHALADDFAQVNIEAAVVWGRQLVLGQRGADGAGSALVFLDLHRVIEQLQRGELTHAAIDRIENIALGALHGVALSLTDLAVGADDRLHFASAAESSKDAYVDGPCAGSSIGRFDAALEPVVLAQVDTLKIEGLCFDAARARWLMVADADDPHSRSPLLSLAAA